MNILFINIFVGFMVSKIPIVSVFGHFPYSVTFPYRVYIPYSVYIQLYYISSIDVNIYSYSLTINNNVTLSMTSIVFIYVLFIN